MECDEAGGGAAGAPARFSLQPEADGAKGPLNEKDWDWGTGPQRLVQASKLRILFGGSRLRGMRER